MLPSLKTSLWVSALLRRAEASGAFVSVMKKGDPDAGSVILKVRNFARGFHAAEVTAYRAMRNMDGERVWWPKGPDREAEIDRYIQGRAEDDPDLWIVEIDDKAGRHFLTDNVETAP